MKREDYVLVFTDKRKTVYCRLCGYLNVHGHHCPLGYSRCSYPTALKPVLFDNRIHNVIATVDKCFARSYECKLACSDCSLARTFENMKIM